MEKADPLQEYTNLQTTVKKAQARNKQRLYGMIWLRLLCFLLLVAFGYLTFRFSAWFFIGAGIFTVGFFILLKINARLEYQRKLHEKEMWVLEQEMRALSYASTAWYDGTRFIQKNTSSFDLDVFGSFSVFHYLNRCTLEKGETLLAASLHDSCTDADTILRNQKCIQELSGNTPFRFAWQSTAQAMPEKKDVSSLFKQSNVSLFEGKKAFPWIVYVLTALTGVGALYYALTNNHVLFLLSTIVNLAVVASYLKPINALHHTTSGQTNTLKGYKNLIQTYLAHSWQTETNAQHALTLKEADKAMAELERITEQFDRRLNILVALAFNALWLNDILVVLRFEKWKKKYAHQAVLWLDTLAAIDALQSKGTFAFNHSYPYPELSHKNELQFNEMAHPLLHVNKRVANSYSVSHPEKIVLITGSNMSGKSTFLRSIGVNVLLAQAGLPVCAKRFVFKPMVVCSSLRQSDSLEENVSLFHAELLRLKSIRETVYQSPFSLVLLDEMLKGTNSEDKLQGSKKLIEEFLDDAIIGFIATHDLALGEMEETHKGHVKNACFESTIENNELYFDYTLKNGVARNKNASFLLKKMGIVKR